ncbi:hypothetical protein MTO96_010034, partial [Rhipicephalus appendiculatus]
MSIFILFLNTTYGLRAPLLCDRRLVFPQCQYPRACHCDQLSRLGTIHGQLFQYDKRRN